MIQNIKNINLNTFVQKSKDEIANMPLEKQKEYFSTYKSFLQKQLNEKMQKQKQEVKAIQKKLKKTRNSTRSHALIMLGAFLMSQNKDSIKSFCLNFSKTSKFTEKDAFSLNNLMNEYGIDVVFTGSSKNNLYNKNMVENGK